ncbi:MAG: hypothetical protein P1P64_10365 [Treponemataceae bacterium]
MKNKINKSIIFSLVLLCILNLVACTKKSDSEAKAIEVDKKENNSITIPRSTDIGDINVHLYDGDMVAQGICF